MSLDFSLYALREVEVESFNVTHNLGPMAKAAGIHDALWCAEEKGLTPAEVASALRDGISLMEQYPEQFKAYDAENGWGTYDDFLPWLKRVARACESNPDAKIHISK